MHFIPQNLKHLRKDKGWTQEEFARQLGVKRSMIGAYEEGRADPKISFLQVICQKFDLSLDALVNGPLGEAGSSEDRIKGANLRILPITIDGDSNTETACLVPQKAAAGYLNGFSDVEFIETLPTFNLGYPEISRGKTYRVFQIKGDSMLPVPPDAYVIASHVLDWSNIVNDECYIIISKDDGIVFKRVLDDLKNGHLTLKSDNPSYEPFDVPAESILEIWRAEGVTVFNLEEIARTSETGIKEELVMLNKRLDDIERRL